MESFQLKKKRRQKSNRMNSGSSESIEGSLNSVASSAGNSTAVSSRVNTQVKHETKGDRGSVDTLIEDEKRMFKHLFASSAELGVGIQENGGTIMVTLKENGMNEFRF